MSRNIFDWGYPPGVTGREYEIVGPDYEQDYDEPCPRCMGPMVEQGYQHTRWAVCVNCGYRLTLDEEDESEDNERI